MKKITTPGLIETVKRELDTHPHKALLNQVVNKVLAGRKCYLWGGAVRDPLIKQRYGRNGHINDFDVLVDDAEEAIDFETIFKGESNVYVNRFGTVKWKPVDGFDIDVSRFSNANIVKTGKFPASLDTSLRSCDFNTSAIAYDLADGTIYDHSALDGIEKQEVDLLEHAGDEPHVMMARLILHADKFGFTIGPRGIALIEEGYTPKLDDSILGYLKYKGLEDKQAYILQRLSEIA